MTARDTLVTTLESLLARTRSGRMDAHRAEAERLVDEALTERTNDLARAQRAFFGDVSAQGNDGGWYGMSDWLTEVP